MNILFNGISNIIASLFTSVDKAGNAKLVSIYARIFLISLVIPFGVIPIINILVFRSRNSTIRLRYRGIHSCTHRIQRKMVPACNINSPQFYNAGTNCNSNVVYDKLTNFCRPFLPRKLPIEASFDFSPFSAFFWSYKCY